MREDCLVNICNKLKSYIIATCDKGLKSRIRKILGVQL